jgi:hypothetical protein
LHRTRLAGRNKPLFTKGAATLVYRASQGIPRVVNTVCDAALVYGFADQKPIIDSKLILSVLEDKARARGAHASVEPSGIVKPVVFTGGQSDIGSDNNSDNKSDKRITEFNRDSAKLLFKKYYHD